MTIPTIRGYAHIIVALVTKLGLVGLAGIALAQNLSSCPTINCWEDAGASTALGDRGVIGGSWDIGMGEDTKRTARDKGIGYARRL